MSLNSFELEIHRKFMKPIRSKPYISIAIPSSITTDSKTLREQTLKIGYIGRATAIFRVEEIMIYSDGDGDIMLIQNILNYLEVPPYLKKSLVPISPRLVFAGLIPPLKTPHHVEPNIFDTSYREGIVVNRYEDRCIIDIGLSKKGIAYGRCPSKGTRVTVEIVREGTRYYYVDIIDKSCIDIYWGYRVQMFSSLKEVLEYAKSQDYLIIIASKKGSSIHNMEHLFIEELKKRDRVIFVFGGPYLDVDEIASKENIALESFVNYIINFVPRQGCINIRTEEAIISVLSIVNYIKEKYSDRILATTS